MVGIIGALEEEVAMFKHDMEIKEVCTIAKCEYVYGILNGQDVVVTKCGMGKVNSAACTSIMISKYHPDIIFNTGVGGALSPDLKALDIMVARTVVQHDYDLMPLGYKRGVVDLFETPYFTCDEKVADAVMESCKKFGYDAYYSRFATGDRFINKKRDISSIVKHFDAQVADMESGSIAQVCTLHGVKFVNIRTISDAGNEMDFNKFLKFASTHSVIVLEDVIENIEKFL